MEDVPEDQAQAWLDDKVERIVVVMLENRSFDHMLGYLSLEGHPVDGLRSGLSNGFRGGSFPIHRLERTAFEKLEDPCHHGDCVERQLEGVDEQLATGEMGGFVADYAEHRPDEADWSIVMGYYDGSQLPAFDHLAREFCVCDRWFCSVPGATWPNRLYALAGHSGKRRDNRWLPLYDLESFARHLDHAGVDWSWYSSDPGSLRAVDGNYRFSHHERFAHFDKRSGEQGRNFLDDAEQGLLPRVSWIDPNFLVRLPGGPPGSNDDHPPSDVRHGQEFVLKIYDALRRSKQWDKTLLIVTYDEHGGFFDHVKPPPVAPADPMPYGPRVPSLVVSPYVGRGSVSSKVYDHTSIIKTILSRFCRTGGKPPSMTVRIDNARHLGELLSEDVARHPEPIAPADGWAPRVFAGEPLVEDLADPSTFDRLRALADSLSRGEVNDLQAGMLELALALRAGGLPPGHP